MFRFSQFHHPATDFLVSFLRGRVRKARSSELDRGASAIEWVIIAAVVIGIVIGVAAIITNALSNRAQSVGDCIEGVKSAGC